MKNQVKLKGQLKSYLMWPILLSILLVVTTAVVLLINVKAGIVAAFGLIIYVVIAAVIYHRIRPVIVSELVNFALDYGQVQKALLYDLQVPYVILDNQGKLLWANKSFDELASEKDRDEGNSSYFSGDHTG